MLASAVAELRTRLAVTQEDVPDSVLDRCLKVATSMIDPYVDPHHRYSLLYGEAVQCLSVRIFEERAAGRGGVDAAGEYDFQYLPGATSGMVRSVWAYIGPISGGPVFA